MKVSPSYKIQSRHAEKKKMDYPKLTPDQARTPLCLGCVSHCILSRSIIVCSLWRGSLTFRSVLCTWCLRRLLHLHIVCSLWRGSLTFRSVLCTLCLRRLLHLHIVSKPPYARTETLLVCFCFIPLSPARHGVLHSKYFKRMEGVPVR